MTGIAAIDGEPVMTALLMAVPSASVPLSPKLTPVPASGWSGAPLIQVDTPVSCQPPATAFKSGFPSTSGSSQL